MCESIFARFFYSCISIFLNFKNYHFFLFFFKTVFCVQYFLFKSLFLNIL